MDGVLPGHEGRPGGRAYRRHVVVVENEARVSQGVQVGRGDLVRAVEAHVVPAL